MKLRRWLLLPVVAVLGTGGVLAQRPVAPRGVGLRGGGSSTDGPAAGLGFRLSEGNEDAAVTERAAPAAALPLGEVEAQKVLDRLPPFAVPAGDAQDFALRDRSLPPPRTGATVTGVFPPVATAERPTAAPAGPLEVLRHAPEGSVPLSPQLSVTFSQPMVAVTSHDALAREAVPVRLTPEPKGLWRWVGTQTLLFEPEGRFPMATTYQAEVPAGTRSAVGGALPAAARWSFTTASPTLVISHPASGPARRDVLLFAAFDQRIDPAAVLATVTVRTGTVAHRLRLATPEEVQGDDAVRRLVAAAEPGRSLAFRTEAPLPGDAEVSVTVGPGTPSAEGPRVTEKPQTWSFRTYGPLRVTEHRCGWGNTCQPLQPWSITLTNPIDAKRFDKAMVRVTPALPGLKVDLYGSSMTIRGASKGRTTYRLTLSSDISDVFGQTLGEGVPLAFTVGPAGKVLWAPGGELVVLDPAAPPRFSAYSINHAALRVRAYAVTSADWPAFAAYMAKVDQGETAQPPGRLAISTDVTTRGAPDELTETRIDLAPALTNGVGQVVLVVRPTVPAKDQWRPQVVRAWVQATKIGLTAFRDATELVTWASSLTDGSPLSGVEVALLPGGATARTGATGLATLALSDKTGILVARSGRDAAVLPEHLYWWRGDSGFGRRTEGESLRWFVFDDRHLYRPGEEVHVKGWVRVLGEGEGGDVAALAGAGRTVQYALSDALGNDVQKGERALGPFGAFDLTLKLPGTMNLGDAHLRLTIVPASQGGATYTHSFQVQEFRRPEFEVAATGSDGPHFVSGHATATVSASYYAGGGLTGADVSWSVTAKPGSFVPPNRDDFTFGIWVPWWEVSGERMGPTQAQSFTGRTDASGRHRVRIDFDRVDPPRPTSVHAEATVMDVNRQAWTSGVDLLVHPSALYVGLRGERIFVQKGEPLKLEAIVTDLDGKAVTGRPVTVLSERLEWEQTAGEWAEKAVDPQECALTSSTAPMPCTFATKEGGTYRVTAEVNDAEGRPNRTEVRRWVAGGKMPPQREVAQEKVTLIPSRKEYRAGETAEILVLSPFAPAEGVLTLRRSGIFKTERFTMSGSSHTLRLLLEEAWTPNVHVQVDLVGAAPRTNDAGEAAPQLPPRPAFAKGALDLALPPHERTLAVTVTPREKALPPGGSTVVDVAVTDASGRPASGAEAAIVVVDEAVLALTGYRVPDPIDIFYSQRGTGAEDYHLRERVLLGRPDELLPSPEEEEKLQSLSYLAGAAAEPVAMSRAMPAPPAPAQAMKAARGRAKADGDGEGAPPIAMRTDFNPLALFVASVVTDAAGKASVPVKLPDNLTRYRVTVVVATEGKSFGKREGTITARLPLMVRPSPPRFLNFGDRIELPVVLQNQTDAPLLADVAVRAANAELTSGSGRRVTVPANDRVEVRFPVAAARAGTARFQIGAVAGGWADAAEVTLPVYTPATTEAFATYGQIDAGAIVQPVAAPAGVVPQFGGLEVTTSSTAVQALTDAVLYLVAYPFECAEQISSRVIAVAALKDVLTAFSAEGLPAPAEMTAAVDRDVKRLRLLQNGDGGFAFWRRGDPSWPYISIHVAHALTRAKAKGFAVPEDVLERSKTYLRDIERHVPEKEYGLQARRTLIAYALYVRSRLGDRDAARARKLVTDAGLPGLSFEAIGWLLPVLSGDPASAAEVTAIRRHLANRVTEEAGTAHFAVSYEDSAHLILHSDRRADAVVLEALIGDQPESNDLIPKLVEGLLAHRTKGRWSNTQENAFVLLALDRYFSVYEKATPDFVARMWLGDTFAGEHAFRGRTTERYHVEVPMRLLTGGGKTQALTLAKEGPGRLYYRIGMRYAPASLTLAPSDHGFTVERAYEGADRRDDVTRGADGTWRIKAGARVRVTLTMVAPSRRYHVALVDPLPAGLEALNPSLAVTGTLPQGGDETVSVIGAPGLGGPGRPGSWWWWRRTWYEHQNLRDERVEAFASLLWEGVYTYSYVARATTPGSFVVPPPKAEEMYHPETFGRGGTDRVVVE